MDAIWRAYNAWYINKIKPKYGTSGLYKEHEVNINVLKGSRSLRFK